MSRVAYLTKSTAIGILIGIMLSLLVLAIRVIGGQAPFRTIGVSITRVISTYLAIGCIGGFITGVCQPIARHRAGAAFLGWFVGTLFAASLRMGEAAHPIWRAQDSVMVCVFGLILGVPLGLVYHHIFTERSK